MARRIFSTPDVFIDSDGKRWDTTRHREEMKRETKSKSLKIDQKVFSKGKLQKSTVQKSKKWHKKSQK